MNIYKAQGRTYDKVYALMNENINYHSFNVMATRHIETLQIYSSQEDLESVLNQTKSCHINSDFKDNESKYFAAIYKLITRQDKRFLAEDWKKIASTLKRAKC
ncbi:MAG UNVERIFIED_CONTAM: hypothetical protein LVQ98_03560 [Rickettsiaceae bacterium]|jgi:regulatory protein YycH of two-component signal transduction system YycFG